MADKVERYVREDIGLGARQEPHQVLDISGRSPVLVTLKSGGVPVPVEPTPKTDEVAETFQWKGEKRTRKVLTLDLGGGVTMEMVRVKAGKFWMGSDDYADEKPVHEVTLTQDFYMAKYPVTRKQFAAFVAATKYETSAEKADDKDGVGTGYDAKENKFVRDKKYTWRDAGFE